MNAERDPEPPHEAPDENPTSEELDVEGPNESAPGHEPSSEGREAETGSTGDPTRSD